MLIYVLSLLILLTLKLIRMEMANYIYSILKANRVVMWSWGFHQPMAMANDEGLIFRVNGFKHTGKVKVVYHAGKDLFVVVLLDRLNNETKRIEEVYFDQLVEVIDELVERTNDYEDRVRDFYSR